MAKAYPISDRESLYLWVTPSGGKIWRWRYRLNSKEKLMTCGKYPAVSLGLARERHAEARKALALGIDPMAKRRTEKTAEQVVQADSFASIATRWLDHWKGGKSERHVDSTRRRLASNILPTLGLLKITEIEAPDLVGMVRTVEARGARDVAKRALETTGQIFRFAIAHSYAKRNPATEIKPRDVLKASSKENLARIDAKELAGLLRQIEVYPGTHVMRLAIKLMALTFMNPVS